MAGSYLHIVKKNGKLISNKKFPNMIENLGDAYEAIEECWHMIDILADGDKSKIAEAHYKYLVREVGYNRLSKQEYIKNYWI